MLLYSCLPVIMRLSFSVSQNRNVMTWVCFTTGRGQGGKTETTPELIWALIVSWGPPVGWDIQLSTHRLKTPIVQLKWDALTDLYGVFSINCSNSTFSTSPALCISACLCLSLFSLNMYIYIYIYIITYHILFFILLVWSLFFCFSLPYFLSFNLTYFLLSFFPSSLLCSSLLCLVSCLFTPSDNPYNLSTRSPSHLYLIIYWSPRMQLLSSAGPGKHTASSARAGRGVRVIAQRSLQTVSDQDF